MKDLFIPDDNFFSGKFDDLKFKLETKLSVESYKTVIGSIQNIASGHMENINVTILGVTSTIVDASFINSVRSTIHGWVRGFMFILLAFYNYNQIIKLIRGTDYIGPSGTNSMGYHVGRKEGS